MNDCPNADIRDQLPDLVHDRLDAGARAAVMMHIDACDDCRAELELLRSVHGALVSRTPRVDVKSIVAAVAKVDARGARSTARPASRQRSWADWRVAAAVVLLVAGGTSVAVLRQPSAGSPPEIAQAPGAPSVQPPKGVVAAPPNAAPAPKNAESLATNQTRTPSQATPTQTVASSAEGLGVSGHLGDLDDAQLKALLDEIDHMEAVPITDPEPVSIKVETRTPAPAPSPGRGR